MKRRIRSKQFVIADTAGFWGRPAASLLLIFIAICLMSFSTVRPGMVETARTSATDALVPVLSLISRPVQYVSFLVRDISGLARMQAEIASLRQENTRLQGWYQKAMQLQTENESLRELMNVKVDAPHEFISARVVADSGNSYVKSLLILAGSRDGVEKGQAVLSGQGLIGRVIEVGRKSARILLITDMNSKVPVVIAGAGYNAVMAGGNEKHPVLDHLPANVHIPGASQVMTSGHGGIFPAGLPVGQAMKTVDTTGPVKTTIYKVSPYSDFEALSFVRIINTDIDPNLKTGALN